MSELTTLTASPPGIPDGCTTPASNDRAMQARPTRRLRHGIIHGTRPAAHAIEWWRVGSTTDEAGSPESSATLCRSKRP